jgi:hypothetical protein
MKTILLILAGLFLIPNLNAATLYRWVDDRGGFHFTDNYETIPAAYRDRAKSQTSEDEPEKATSSLPQPSLRKSEENTASVNPLSQNETYWRDRARPWKEKVAEAKENYENATKKYMEKSEQLSQRKFASRTQYKMDIADLDKLNGERKKCEAQLNEAKEMLGKISREAEESNANPEWVK